MKQTITILAALLACASLSAEAKLKTCTYVRDVTAPDVRSGYHLYKCSPAMDWYSYVGRRTHHTTAYIVVVTYVELFHTPSTTIYPADSTGKLTDAIDPMDGSYSGGTSAKTAIEAAGYVEAK